MKYLIVYAHPDPRSLNGSLKDRAVQALRESGHEVRVSDLYAMRFKAVADAEDFPARDTGERLVYHRAQGEAYAAGSQSEDIREEQEKLLWADIVVLQFPLWWFSVPAIMKGWIDRVFGHGFVIGVPRPAGGWLRYGEGRLSGRRAMLAITTGGREEQFSPRGINGEIRELLFHLNHGVFHYTSMTVLEPFVAYRTARLPTDAFDELAERYIARLKNAPTSTPLRYRSENGGDYGADGVVRDDIASSLQGLATHVL